MKVIAPGVKVTDNALTQVVARAAEGVDGARVRRPRRTVDIEIENGRARVDLGLVVAYGKVLPEVARDVQAEIADALGRMCDVEVDAIDVTVDELE
jgi:uncharacterized alkaline shock family protein YloU